ncbi:MAG TPA: PilZ domain-containing protein [Terriglobales bacterium]|jgi:hypothetical protein|nr:PilZ domain-containing protein [Terriglobales bacterium]
MGMAPLSRAGAVGLASRPPRRHYRHPIPNLAYVNLDHTNGGIIRNLGETGVAIQAVAPVCTDQQVFLRFELGNPRLRVEATGRVAWIDSLGQAGIEFLAVSQRCRRQLKEWIFIQLLSTALQTTGDLNLAYGRNGEAAALLFSAAGRPAIRLAPRAAETFQKEEKDQRARALHLSWLPFAIGSRALSRLVDGLILLSSVLLFIVICVAIVGAVPTWPVAAAFSVGVTGALGGIYWLLFLFWIGCTPGSYLARLACQELEDGNLQREERARFR